MPQNQRPVLPVTTQIQVGSMCVVALQAPLAQRVAFMVHIVLRFMTLAGHIANTVPASVPLSVPESLPASVLMLASVPASIVSQGSHAILLFGAQKQTCSSFRRQVRVIVQAKS